MTLITALKSLKKIKYRENTQDTINQSINQYSYISGMKTSRPTGYNSAYLVWPCLEVKPHDKA